MRYLIIVFVLFVLFSSCSKEKVHEINEAYVGTWYFHGSGREYTIIRIDENSNGEAIEGDYGTIEGDGFDFSGTFYIRSGSKLIVSGSKFKIINEPHEVSPVEVKYHLAPDTIVSTWEMVLKDPVFWGSNEKTYYKVY